MPSFYRKQPKIIEAVRWDGYNVEEIDNFLGKRPAVGHKFTISTLEGMVWVSVGDWVIKGIAGEFYPCKDEVFKQSYEHVSHKE